MPSRFAVPTLVSRLVTASAPRGLNQSHRQFLPPEIPTARGGIRRCGGELTDRASPVEPFRSDRPELSWEDPEIGQSGLLVTICSASHHRHSFCQSVNTQVMCDNLLICFPPINPHGVSLLPWLIGSALTPVCMPPSLILELSSSWTTPIARMPSTVSVYL